MSDLALKHSIQLEKLVKRIKDLELLVDIQSQTNDEFHLRLTKLESLLGAKTQKESVE